MDPGSAGLASQHPAGQGAEPIIAGGYADPALQERRLGQGTFRALVTDAYGRRCAITREKALPALDAAHIRPFSDVHEHRISNGVLLRSDVHRLFDAGYITITPELRVEVSRRMKEDFDDGDNHLRLHGTHVRVPAEPVPRFLPLHVQIVGRLEVQPEPVRGAEIAGEAKHGRSASRSLKLFDHRV
ncbi:MAG: HNH endonuclease [Gemmatimonadota bacterium]